MIRKSLDGMVYRFLISRPCRPIQLTQGSPVTQEYVITELGPHRK
jgi:hypothetical protein